MAKKKAEAAKPKPPRQKKLRLVDNSPIGLTDAQQQELRDLYRPLSQLTGLGLNWDDRAAQQQLTLDRYLYIYIEALCCDARAENANQRGGRSTSLRRKIVGEIAKLTGRAFSPDDIIKALAKHAPVPKFAANAIRRDYLRCTV